MISMYLNSYDVGGSWRKIEREWVKKQESNREREREWEKESDSEHSISQIQRE